MSERVSPDFVKAMNRKSTSELNRILRAGISDQRQAFLREAIRRRSVGASPIAARTKALARFQEQVRVAERQKAQQRKFQGPTRPGTDLAFFRKTGKRRPTPRKFQGPTRPGMKVDVFRKSGISKRKVSVSLPPTKLRGMISAVKQEKGIEGLSQKVRGRRSKLRTEGVRAKTPTKGVRSIKEAKREAELFALSVAQSLLEIVIAGKNLISKLPKAPEAIIDAIKNPKASGESIITVVKSVPAGLKGEGQRIGRLAQVSPTEFLAEVGTNILLLKGSGKAFQVIGKVTPKAKIKISPKLKRVKESNVVMVGAQKQKGNKIITEIIFKTDKGREGVARGFTIQKGKKTITFTVGRSAKRKRKGKVVRRRRIRRKRGALRIRRRPTKRVVKRRKIKRGFKEGESFVGVERGASGKVKFKEIKEIKGVGKAIKNLEEIRQVSFGRTAQARGNKILKKVSRTRKGKLKVRPAKGLRVKDFVSIANVFTRKDFNLIVGRTFTNEKDIINFIGLIKGAKGSGKTFEALSKGQKLIYKKALQNVVNTVAAASLKSQKIISKISPKSQKIISKLSPRVKVQISKRFLTPIGRKKLKLKARVRSRQVLTTTKTIQALRSKAKLALASKLASKQKLTQRQKQIIKQKSSVALKQRIKQLVVQKSKTVQRTKLVSKGVGARPRAVGARVLSPGIVRLRRRKKTKTKTMRKGDKAGFNVFGKSKNKWIRLNKKPISRLDALSRGAYAIDHSTSKRLRVRPAGVVKKLGSIKKKERNYYNKNKVKFRPFKIKGKRKFPLRETQIEKRRFGIDTPGEKRQLSLARLAKREGYKKKRVVKRKSKRRPTQAQVLKKFKVKLDFKGFPKRARRRKINPFKPVKKIPKRKGKRRKSRR